jgi:hypothetical protein
MSGYVPPTPYGRAVLVLLTEIARERGFPDPESEASRALARFARDVPTPESARAMLDYLGEPV